MEGLVRQLTMDCDCDERIVVLGGRGPSCLPLTNAVVGQRSECSKENVLSKAWFHLTNRIMNGLLARMHEQKESKSY